MRQRTNEIVHVLSDDFLINSAWHVRRYTTRDGQPLKPGFYFVLWPAQCISPRYDRRARYFGPFASRTLAATLKTSALALGLIDPTKSAPFDAGDRSYAQEVWHGASRGIRFSSFVGIEKSRPSFSPTKKKAGPKSLMNARTDPWSRGC